MTSEESSCEETSVSPSLDVDSSLELANPINQERKYSSSKGSMVERFQAAMEELCPKWPQGRYLCAFSGGSDSTALLSLLAQCLASDQLLAVHLDHGLRETSAGEAIEAVKMAGSMGVVCESARIDVNRLAKERGKGIEEAARVARYDFLREKLRQWGGDCIVTAHQAEDLAETIIMKLARGVGPSGLVGIAAANQKTARPLLSFSKKELLDYLNSKSLSWIEDQSNQEMKFKRNQVRKTILPQIEKLNPAYLEALGRASKLASAEEEFWENHLKGLFEKLVSVLDDGGFRLEVFGLMHLALAERRRLVGKVLREVKLPGPAGGEPVSFASVETLLKYARQPGAGGVDLPGGRRVEWRGHYLHIGPASRYKSTYRT
jgi:tRNA(Ile)-lysidine synthase